MKLYSEEFAADPHLAYQAMRRQHGPLAPVELAPGVPATLVIGYREALHILSDPEHFPACPAQLSAGLSPRPADHHATLTAPPHGADPARYRSAYTAALSKVDLYALREGVGWAAMPLVNRFCEAGSADLLEQYAFPLTASVFSRMLGFGPEVAEQMFGALTELRAATTPEDTAQASQRLAAEIHQAVAAKSGSPAADVVSWLATDPIGLDDGELAEVTAMLYAAGIEPTCNLIANTLLLLLTDDQFSGGVLGGALSTQDAIDTVLFSDPPLANSCVRYPRQPQIIGETWLPADQPVIISLAASNGDSGAVGGDRTRNRSHLAWGAGTHACTAQQIVRVIVAEALDQLLDVVPDLKLAVPVERLEWRTGGVHRALESLPVTFPAAPPLNVL